LKYYVHYGVPQTQLDASSSGILKGFSSKTLAARPKKLERSGVLRENHIMKFPKLEYNLTDKGQEIVESIIDLLQWMRK
jgi:DNA-binding HxlR family transcriptional regulator